MQNRWKLKPQPDSKQISLLSQRINTPSIVSSILIQRGIDTYDKAKKFFSPEMSDLYDPYLMKDMDIAVSRILKAIQKEENILVYGDYDVDGTTSVSLMYLFLKKLSPNVNYYIPDRHKEGYGISKEGIEYAKENGFSLIITLDCGIKAFEQVKLASGLGIDMIICDHHLPEDKLPEALAVLDPQREDCSYPFGYLSGCGVGFKLIQALAKQLNISDQEVYNYLDLVAVSIAADIVPLIDENRVLAKFGMKILEENPRPGLKVMIPEKMEQLSISNIVFGIAPKINAAGRIDHASKSVELLTAESEPEARKIIYNINEFNNKRRELDASTTEEALDQIEKTEQKENATSIVYRENWNKGVIGIVASRLIEKHYKPTLVFTDGGEDTLVASARSVKSFDIYSALEECSPLLEQFGGHMYAAGLSLKKQNFESFKSQFEDVVKNSINIAQTVPEIEIDTETDLGALNEKLFRIIARMKPFGPKNMKPVFLSRNLLYGGEHKIIGKTQEHLQFSVFEPDSKKFMKVTAFNFADQIKKIKKHPFDLVYTLDENHWQGKVYYKLMAKDIRFHEE